MGKGMKRSERESLELYYARGVAEERAAVREFVVRLRGRVELHAGGSVLDAVLDSLRKRELREQMGAPDPLERRA